MILLGLLAGSAGFALTVLLLNGIAEALGMAEFSPNYVPGIARRYPWAYNIFLAVVVAGVGYLSSLGSLLVWYLCGVAIMPILMGVALLYFTFLEK